jgi:hypothetical protein
MADILFIPEGIAATVNAVFNTLFNMAPASGTISPYTSAHFHRSTREPFRIAINIFVVASGQSLHLLYNLSRQLKVAIRLAVQNRLADYRKLSGMMFRSFFSWRGLCGTQKIWDDLSVMLYIFLPILLSNIIRMAYE